MNPRLLVLVPLAAAAPAQADPRIATRAYQASSVVTIHGRAGIESTIAFAPDERIENVAVGNSASWQVTPNKRANLLFVKPASLRAHTNMTVITDQRTYLFDLVSVAAGVPVYMLQFSYPQTSRPTPIAKAAVPEVVAAVAAMPVPVAATPSPTNLDFNWQPKGDRQLLPSRSFDDGRVVYLQWPRDANLPAILTREANGAEGPVNYTVQGEYIVVEGVPAQLILRTGKQMATLTAPPGRPRTSAVPSMTETASARP